MPQFVRKFYHVFHSVPRLALLIRDEVASGHATLFLDVMTQNFYSERISGKILGKI